VAAALAAKWQATPTAHRSNSDPPPPVPATTTSLVSWRHLPHPVHGCF
jgi:hypothetical protein